MREITAAAITKTIKGLCQEANVVLGEDMLRAFDRALSRERSPAGRQVLEMIKDKFITAAEVVAYEDLGTEAIRRLTVEDFPVIVVNDAHGADLYEAGVKQYARPAEVSR